MTFIIKMRGAPHATERADYECPVHGRFEAEVPRPAPSEFACPGVDAEDDGHEHCRDYVCGEPSPWRMSAPGMVHVRRGEVVRGKSDPHPGDQYVMDTRPLADGMPLAEFKARRAKVHRDISLARVRKALGR